MPPGPERCSAISRAYDEPMDGTASTVRSWLLIEHAGPWGRDALLDARLPGGLGLELLRLGRAAGVRPVLIRRGGRRSPGTASCFAVRSGPEEPWIERTLLRRLEDALELDVQALGRGDRLGLEPVGAPLFLVCTHGRHDVCCAEQGRPVAESLANAFPDETWECSHIGGDRFAANVIAFPHGVYFGRVQPDAAPEIAAAYAAGRIDLRHLRGRSTRPMPVQAAEHMLRRNEGLDRLDDVRIEATWRTTEGYLVTMWTPRGRFDVRIARDAAPPRRLTCRSVSETSPPHYRPISIDPHDDV
jgi:hypothetical protein